MWTEFIAVGWIALELTDSPFFVALVKFFRMFPLVLTGLFSGVLIDRLGRRRVMVMAQGVHFLVVVTLAFLFGPGHGEYWHLVAGSFLLGVGFSLDYPARRSLIHANHLDGWEGLRSLAIGDAIYESALTGEVIRVDDVISGKRSQFQDPIDAHWDLT